MAGIGFPDATNTGVPAGVTLTPSGGLTINTPGIVIEGLDIRGMVTINADNVTLKNCTISASSWAVINITSGSTGVVIQDCEINGLNAEGVRGISVSGQATLLRNDIHNVEDGIYLQQGTNILIQDNYIHGLQSNNSGPHYDGIQTDGGISNVVISHNTIINDHGQTSAINLSNYFGSVRDVVIDNNRLVGGGYTIYSDGQFSSGGTISGVSITNNDLGKGQYGYTSINKNTPVFTGNYDDITGSLLPGQQAGNPSTVITTFSTDSGTLGDGLTNDDTLTLSGTAAANSAVKVLEGTTQVGETTANGSGAWSVTTSALPDGSHSFTATATSGGTTSASSSPLTVRVDTVAPSAPTIASFSTDTGTVGDGITSDNILVLTGIAAANSTVKLYDGSMLLGSETANGSGAWSYTTGVLSNASHSLTATATDAAGNISVASSVLAVTVNTAGTGVPTIAAFSPDSGTLGDGLTNDNTLTLSGTAAANSTVKVLEGTTQVGQATADGSGAWSVTTAALADGSHSFTATATSGGMTSAASSPLTVGVDTVAPSAPTIASFSMDTGTVGDGITSDNVLVLTGIAAASSTVKLYDGSMLLGTATANGSGAWSYTTDTLADAAHNFMARATDAAGNTSVASSILAITVDSDGSGPTPSTGTSGNDVLPGTSGADVMTGLGGNDTYTVNNSGDQVVELANEGADKVESTISYTLAGNVENLQLMGSASISGTGNSLNNTIIGNDVSNTLKGNAGNDTLNGWGGKDTLIGDSGSDVFQFSSQFSADGDKVMDFVHGVDKLDFSKIDARTSRSGDQAFIFDGYEDSGSNGHLWAVEDQGAGVTHVYGKTGDFQFHIDVQGVDIGLTWSDFIL